MAAVGKGQPVAFGSDAPFKSEVFTFQWSCTGDEHVEERGGPVGGGGQQGASNSFQYSGTFQGCSADLSVVMLRWGVC